MLKYFLFELQAEWVTKKCCEKSSLNQISTLQSRISPFQNFYRLAVNKYASLRAKILSSPNFRCHMNNYLQTRLYDINFNLYESITLSLQKRNRTNILGIETDNDKILQWRAGKAFEGFKNLLCCYKTHGISFCFPSVWRKTCEA